LPFNNEQESFWSGEFGDDYISRNQSAQLLASNIALFSRALSGTSDISSVLELGANIGLNLTALSTLFPRQNRTGVEINEAAFRRLDENEAVNRAIHSSILDLRLDEEFDLVLVKGVLIHLAPESLPAVYHRISLLSRKYILFVEYFSPSPVELDYRGHSGKLFKRDFAGEFLASQPSFCLEDYGFVYHGDPTHPLDDLNWFLLRRSG
jgi:pseudaminic acid biosynthesis-associated methylase